MSTSTHGSRELRAHAEAAKTLSETRAAYRRIAAKVTRDSTEQERQDLATAEVAYAAAYAAERAAYALYTNPFGIEKTVSAR